MDRLEEAELNFRYCRLCEIILTGESDDGEIIANTENEEEDDPSKIDQMVVQHV